MTPLRELVARAPCPAALLDERERLRETSHSLLNLLGYSREDAINAPLTQFVHAPDREVVAAWLHGEGPAPKGVQHLVERSGRLVPVHLDAVPCASAEGGDAERVVYVTPLRAEADAVVPADIAGALDRIQDGFVVFDREWRFVAVNRTAEDYFQVPRETLLGRTLWTTLPRIRGSQLEEKFRLAAEAEEPTEFELVAPHRHRWTAFRTYPSPEGLSVYFRDSTDRKQAEAALRASEAQYRSVFETSLHGILLSTPSGAILAANPEACRLLGYTEEELRRVGRTALVGGDDMDRAGLLRTTPERRAARGELTLLRKDGTTFSALVSASAFVALDGTERVTVAFVDIRERKRFEAALELLARAGAVLSASLDGDATLNALAGTIVPARADGCWIDRVEGEALRRVAVAGEPVSAAAVHVEAAVREAWRSGVSQIVPGDSDHGRSSAIVVPIAADGATLGVLSLLAQHGSRFDEGDLRLAQRLADHAALAMANAQHYRAAVEATRARDEMLGMVSHDLRNPLHIIALNAMLLSNNATSSRECVTRIVQSVRNASKLVDDLLTIAKMDANKLTLMCRDEDMSNLFDEIVADQRPVADEKNISLTAAVFPGTPKVHVDRHRMQQLLGNLVSNALKHTPAGGNVMLLARVMKGQLQLVVNDNGAGIPPEQLPHVFDRFWQGEGARSLDAGLGLAIAKGIALAHRGTIEVRSELGRGTTFTVYVPLEAPPPA